MSSRSSITRSKRRIISHRSSNKLELRERRSCFAWPKAVDFRTLCFLTKTFSNWANRKISKREGLLDRPFIQEFESSIGHLEAPFATDNSLGHRNRRWALSNRFHRAWRQGKCEILSKKYSGGCFKAMDRQIFRWQTMNVSTGLGTVSQSSNEPRMAENQRSELHCDHIIGLKFIRR